MLWWCEISTGITPARALTITRFPAQKSACKDLGTQWSKCDQQG
ncbi:hypothetical protein HMPREF0541_02762 [Lacticaseibacillus rhamnosus ATCC 21052]|nr:hypothetical protein HMPREF0541_02762 [Lacticaseibacillus rhamnosus ATCC 21052]